MNLSGPHLEDYERRYFHHDGFSIIDLIDVIKSSMSDINRTESVC